MISERQKLILWPMIEEFFGINPIKCGTRRRDQVEHFFLKVGDIFDERIEELRDSVNETRAMVDIINLKFSELSKKVDNF